MWRAIAEQEGRKARLNIKDLDFDIAGGRGFHRARTAPPSRGKEGDDGRGMMLRGASRGKVRRQGAEGQSPVVKRGLGAPLVGQH